MMFWKYFLLQSFLFALLVSSLEMSVANPIEPKVLPWSTEPLSWSTPTNVSINHFDDKHQLLLPIQQSIMLRVYTSPRCAAVDSDLYRAVWWAEVRRHVPHESALALGNVDASNLPQGLTASMFGIDESRGDCSGIAFLPFGFREGSKLEREKVAPRDSDGMRAFVAWISNAFRTFCKVKNPLDRKLTLYWVDDGLDPRELLQVGAGESVPQNTFVGHIYLAKDSNTKEVVDWWAMSGTPEYVITDRASVLSSSCQSPVVDSPASEKLNLQQQQQQQQEQGSEQEGCASPDPEQSSFDFMYDSSMVKRYALNTVQPKVVHNYSDVGYKVLPLPPHTYQWLKQWYVDNVNNEIVETSAGAVGTQHLAPWYVRHIPWHLKQRLIRELRPILAEWSGYENEDLEMTSIYGIRRYSRGSVLRMHVDTAVTHVVSTIINVDQVGIERDWPLEIKSHDGNYHYVNMKPGEMLLYESAKAIHGRPQPLQGDSYSNIFLHFKPKTPGLWEYEWY